MKSPVDLDEVRRRSAELREAEREGEIWSRRPLVVNLIVCYWRVACARWWATRVIVRRALFRATARLIFAREYVRDCYLVLRGRPLYVRCAHFCDLLHPCRRDATWTLTAGEMPILCSEHNSPPMLDGEVEVGRWYRAPAWERRIEVSRRLTRPADPG